MLKAHRIRINPTPEQADQMWRACGIRRSAWNWVLAEYKAQYEAGSKPKFADVVKKYRRERPEWTSEFGAYVYDTATRDLQKAFDAFFRRVKAGEKPGYPRFKSRYDDAQGFYVHNRQFHVDGNSVVINAFGSINMAEPLRFDGKIMGGRVTKRGGHWYLTIQVDDVIDEPARREGEAVGVDVGIKTLAVTSDGTEYPNAKHYARNERHLARLQRIKARKVKGSKRSQRVKLKIQRLHETVADARRDAQHKATDAITKRYATIGVEDLNIRGMVKNHKLAKAVSDAAFGEVIRQLEYKSKWRGGRVVKVGRWYASSKTCNACGGVNDTLTLSDRTWICQHCGAVHDRDWNAAINIRDEAVRIAAAGECSHPAVSLGRKAQTSRAEVGVHGAGL